MASCGGGSVLESMEKEVDDFFHRGELNVAKVSSGEAFMQFFQNMEAGRDSLVDAIDKKYGDKGISEEDFERFKTYLYDRATAYNDVEAQKAAEFIGPVIDEVETYTNELYAQFKAGEALDVETVRKFHEAFLALAYYDDYDNVLPELHEQFNGINAKLDEMGDVLTAKVNEL